MLQVGPHVRPHTSFGAVLGTPAFDHFVATFDTEELGGTSSATKTLVLPFVAGYEVHWGDGVINNLNTHTYSTGGEWTVEIFEPVTTFAYQNLGDKLKLVDMVSLGDGFEINTTGTWQGCKNMIWSTTDTADILTTNLSNTFSECFLLNGVANFSTWNVSLVVNFTNMFFQCLVFAGGGVENWNVGSGTNFTQMFFGNKVLAAEIGVWNMISATNISGIFRSATGFNKSVNNWILTSVQQANHVFAGCNYNQQLNGWNVSSFTTTHAMLGSAFNQTLSSWRFDSATDTSWMFAGNSTFNNQLGDGNFPLVTNMSNMFGGASSYNQDMSGWLVPNVTNMATMLDNSGMSTTNYDGWLVALDGQTLKPNIPMGAQGLTYTGAGAGGTARASLIIAPDFMTISGDSSV